MSKQSIQIERLEIRLKGISPESARAAVSDLGRDLAGRLAWPRNLPGGRRAVRIGRIEAGMFRLPGESAPSELRRVVAQRIAAAIEAKLKWGDVERSLSTWPIF